MNQQEMFEAGYIDEDGLMTPKGRQASRERAKKRLKKVEALVKELAKAKKYDDAREHGLDVTLNNRARTYAETWFEQFFGIRLNDERVGPEKEPDDMWNDPRTL